MTISFLITHYNRPNELLKCIEAIQDLQIPDSEIVVSDDFSDVDCIKRITKYEIDQLILSKKNLGLAANINRGIHACKGKYIVYCQEDFILKSGIGELFDECIEVIESKKVDMIRFCANYQFNALIKLSNNINLIPKFSFKNFFVNPFQYSDNPYITTKYFFKTYGYLLENTSGDYGETEFAIRIFKSNAKIGITSENFVSNVMGSKSVIDRRYNNSFTFFKNRYFRKLIRSFRLYFEFILYNKTKRGLVSYKNLRKKYD